MLWEWIGDKYNAHEEHDAANTVKRVDMNFDVEEEVNKIMNKTLAHNKDAKRSLVKVRELKKMQYYCNSALLNALLPVKI